jgi:hypothetical protein
MKKQNIVKQIRYLNTLLVKKDYQEIVNNDFEKKVSIEGLKEAVQAYGGSITMPPEWAYQEVDIYENKNTTNKVAVDFKIWVDGEQSDLTLSCTIVQLKDDRFLYTVDDLRVQ